MTAQLIDGKKIAAEIRAEVRAEAEQLKASGITPGLATLLVGEDPASQIYVRNKHKACADAGIISYNHVLPKNSDTKTVLAKVKELADDPRVHALLVQLPLPSHVDTETVMNAVPANKDADGFHPENLGKMLIAKDFKELTEAKRPIPLPCTPHGVIVLLQKSGISIAGKNAVVVGRSTIVGKPAGLLLLAHHATVTIAHSKTKNLLEYTKEADILVAAVGRSRMITGDMIKPGAAVIDVGMNRNADGSLSGDVDFEPAKERAGWITPVPGGVGPMTIAMLLKNTILLARTAK